MLRFTEDPGTLPYLRRCETLPAAAREAASQAAAELAETMASVERAHGIVEDYMFKFAEITAKASIAVRNKALLPLERHETVEALSAAVNQIAALSKTFVNNLEASSLGLQSLERELSALIDRMCFARWADSTEDDRALRNENVSDHVTDDSNSTVVVLTLGPRPRADLASFRQEGALLCLSLRLLRTYVEMQTTQFNSLEQMVESARSTNSAG